MNVTRGSKLINDKHERNYDTRSLRFHLSMELSVKRSGGKQEASSRMWQKRTSWRRHSNSRERNWHSRLNGNRRWFVRQNSFSGFARRSFSRQLQGEKGRPLFVDLPTRFYFLNALLYSLFLAFTLISLPVPRLLDIWTHTKNATSVAREKGLGNRLQDSLPSLNERETLHTAQRVGFFVLFSGLCVLLVLSLSLFLSRSCYPSRLFPSFGERVLLVWDGRS